MMMDEHPFVSIAALIGEPARARMLWSLLDGRAYTAGELAIEADISATAASNHLGKLLEADLLKAERQGRHRYFSFSKPEIAYVVESLANLAPGSANFHTQSQVLPAGIRYCRSCYDHLAGFVGVGVADAMQKQKFIQKTDESYQVTKKGWEWLAQLDINRESLMNSRRPLIRPCLDWSERRVHLAGQLGSALLTQMLENDWFRKRRSSRELLVTAKGRKELDRQLGLELA
jgi:DNA-binding transcriptional ArsR family regulator